MPSALGPLRSLAGRTRLALRIWRWWLLIRLGVTRLPLPQFIAQLGAPPARRHGSYRPVALGRAVDRTLRIGAWQPTCLTKALVFYRLLREQGEPAELVIGLPARARNHAAHAWVELDAVDIGPPPGRGDHVPLARFPDRAGARAVASGWSTAVAHPAGPEDGGAALLALLRADATAARLSAATWKELTRIAVRERVAPLAFVAASQLGEGAVPRDVWLDLGQRYGQSLAAGARGYAQLAEVLALCAEARVIPMLLKGVALARFTYATPALRPFGDLDLLVLPEQVETAHRALVGGGYALAGGTPTAADLRWRHARGYSPPQGRGLSLDLHWRFIGYPLQLSLDYAAVSSRAKEIGIDGARALLPSPADLVVALSISFLREIWYGKPRLRYLCDIAEVVGRNDVDWDLVTRISRETPLTRTPLSVALTAAGILLGASVPPDAENALGAGRRGLAGHLGARVRRQLFLTPRPWDAVVQVATMRWIDEGSPAALLRWLYSLVAIPEPLAQSRGRWVKRMWRDAT